MVDPELDLPRWDDCFLFSKFAMEYANQFIARLVLFLMCVEILTLDFL